VGIPSGWELVLVVLLIMVLFGYKKLPDATRSLSRSMRIFKTETKGLRDDSDTEVGATRDTTVTAEPLPPVPPVPPPPPPGQSGAPDARGTAAGDQAQHPRP
jgi:sec-independent protein translocase protein TatA